MKSTTEKRMFRPVPDADEAMRNFNRGLHPVSYTHLILGRLFKILTPIPMQVLWSLTFAVLAPNILTGLTRKLYRRNARLQLCLGYLSDILL